MKSPIKSILLEQFEGRKPLPTPQACTTLEQADSIFSQWTAKVLLDEPNLQGCIKCSFLVEWENGLKIRCDIGIEKSNNLHPSTQLIEHLDYFTGKVKMDTSKKQVAYEEMLISSYPKVIILCETILAQCQIRNLH